ncbi:MAG: DUF2480 family protein [Bacteroidia bacterium]
MENEIVNKVAESGLVTINLEDFYPEGERVVFDMKDYLYEELLLREKDFREFVKKNDWSKFIDKFVAITCSNDAIVASWAYMLVASALEPHAKKILFGNLETLETVLFHDALIKIKAENYRDQRIVIKGCSDKPVPVSAYVELTALLKPFVKSIMYGEPCSAVPIYKSKKASE